MDNRKRPSGVLALGFLFLGAALLPISYSVLKNIFTFISWPHFVIVVMPQIIIYLVCSLIVFNKWDELSNVKKAVLVGIGLQALLLLLTSVMIHELLIERSAPYFISGILFKLNIVLSPLESLYQKIIISHRTVSNESGIIYGIYHWEAGLIFPALRLIFAGAIGGFICKYIEAKKA